MIVAIFTGSRYWNDRAAVHAAFASAEKTGILYVVTGDQRGLDRLAYEVALERGHHHRVAPVHAFWKEDGNRAGNVRNKQMVNVALTLAEVLSTRHSAYFQGVNTPYPCQYVRGYAFPEESSVGTWNCVDDMKAAGIAYELHGIVAERKR